MYQIGDQFVVARRPTGVGPDIGDIGTLVDIKEDLGGHSILFISWERYSRGHSCGGRCDSGHGWNYRFTDVGDLILWTESMPNEIDLSYMEELL